MCWHTITQAPSSMHPSVLYTSSPFSRRYTFVGQTYRQGFPSHVRQTCVSTVMKGSSSNSNLSSPTRSSAVRTLDASGFGGSGMESVRGSGRRLIKGWPRDDGHRSSRVSDGVPRTVSHKGFYSPRFSAWGHGTMAERFDAIVVGAGPAGSAAALTLARKKFSVVLVERGRAPGAKNMFGGRIYAWPLFELVPDWAQDCPVERVV